MKVLIRKKERILLVCDNGKIIYSCRISLGQDPNGPKMREGDGKTPEGTYRICSKNPRSKYRLSMGISYPSSKDAQIALETGLIDEETASMIAAQDKPGGRTPWDTPMGGWIMLHGEHPDHRAGDWTAGCIAVSNTDIDKLYEMLMVNDEITITG